MTGPHLTPEREAALRARFGAAHEIHEVFAALDAERDAHAQTRAALETGTTLLTIALRHVDRDRGFADLAARIDAHIQEAQRVLGLAVPEADK